MIDLFKPEDGIVYCGTNQFKFCEKWFRFINFFSFKHSCFKHATFFCVNRHKLGLLNKEMKGLIWVAPLFSPHSLASLYMLQQRKTQRQPFSCQEPSHIINVYTTHGHYSSTSLKAAQVPVICFQSMWSMCSLTSCHCSWLFLKSCIHTMQQHVVKDGTRRCLWFI